MFTILWQDEQGDHRQQVKSGFSRLGRATDNDIVIDNRSVSRKHAVLLMSGANLVIKDVGSQNGTRRNGYLVRETSIGDDDEVRVGDVALHFVLSAEGDSVSLKPQEMSGTPAPPLDLAGSVVLSSLDISSGEIPASVETHLVQSGLPTMLATLANVAQEMMRFSSLNDLLERIIDLVFRYVPVENAFLLLHEEQLGELVPKVARARDGGEAAGAVSTYIVQRVFRTRECILTQDAREDPRFADGVSIAAWGIRSVMCVPLWARDATAGVLFVDSTTRAVRLQEHHLHFLSLLANVATSAIEQVRLQRRIQEETALKERLMRYQSPSLVEKLLTQKPGGDPLEPAEREVTVLFADMVGFTTRAEHMRPREVALLLNRFFSIMVEVIFEHEGTLDKFIGDCVMAIFGAPHDQPDHARRAVAAAIEIKERLNAFNQEQGNTSPINVRIGINSGVAVAGDIGSNLRVEYTVLGNAVNVASRLQSLVAQPGEIVIGEETHRALGGEWEADPLPPSVLKGIGTPVHPYRLTI